MHELVEERDLDEAVAASFPASNLLPVRAGPNRLAS